MRISRKSTNAFGDLPRITNSAASPRLIATFCVWPFMKCCFAMTFRLLSPLMKQSNSRKNSVGRNRAVSSTGFSIGSGRADPAGARSGGEEQCLTICRPEQKRQSDSDREGSRSTTLKFASAGSRESYLKGFATGFLDYARNDELLE